MFKLLSVAMLFVAVALGDDTLSDWGAMEYPGLSVRQAGATNGIPTDIRFTPWQVAIVRQFTDEKGSYTVFKCSGSIIAEYSVLTAAHCLFYDNGTENTVNVAMAGATDYRNGSAHHISSKFHHPSWKQVSDGRVPAHDIGLMDVEERFKYDAYRRSIPLYDQPMNTLEGHQASACGWGLDDNAIIPSNDIKVIFLEILPTLNCAEYLSHHFNITLPVSQICGLGVNLLPNITMNICDGDSGGAIVMNHTLVAIISWSVDCGETGSPGVFNGVAPYRDWILEQID